MTIQYPDYKSQMRRYDALPSEVRKAIGQANYRIWLDPYERLTVAQVRRRDQEAAMTDTGITPKTKPKRPCALYPQVMIVRPQR